MCRRGVVRDLSAWRGIETGVKRKNKKKRKGEIVHTL